MRKPWLVAALCATVLTFAHHPASNADVAPKSEERPDGTSQSLPKAPPAAIGTPPILTREGSSIEGSSSPSKPTYEGEKRQDRAD